MLLHHPESHRVLVETDSAKHPDDVLLVIIGEAMQPTPRRAVVLFAAGSIAACRTSMLSKPSFKIFSLAHVVTTLAVQPEDVHDRCVLATALSRSGIPNIVSLAFLARPSRNLSGRGGQIAI